ncbi:MAG TPA: hypothetical protein VFU60_09810 [Ktedonobacterales bacterium]|nr:hypothetical protein [Ktedonobacterales bacterium]
MIDLAHLTDEQRDFIESLGVYFEHYGVSRLVGRLMALLMLADRPLTLDDMAQALLVSRASVSTNIRMAVGVGFAARVGIPGDRRDFYRYNDNVWQVRTRQTMEAARGSRVIAEHGLASLGADDPLARERLEEMREYCDFIIEESRQSEERWVQHKRAYRAARREAATARSAPRLTRGDHHNGHNGHNGHDERDDIASVSDEGLTAERDD